MERTISNLGTSTPNLRRCERCGRTYDWRRSASVSLKMTYCTSLCEAADLGMTVDGLLRDLGRAA